MSLVETYSNTPHGISVKVDVPAVREYFKRLERRHKGQVAQPQQGFDTVDCRTEP